jgi:PAS domain S-box-containing protein
MSEPDKPGGEQILVVDDDPSVGEVIGEVLKREGYSPIICAHPLEALEVSKREPFCLAFIDINLPDMNGLALAAELKRSDPLREIVFVTGHGTFDIAVQAIKIGAYDYLRKPFNINEITLSLRRFEERQELRQRIQLSEQRYAQLVRNLPLLIFVIRRDFTLEFVNEALSSVLGYGPSEAVGVENWLMHRIHSEDRKRIRSLFESSFRTGARLPSVECRFVHKKGHLIQAILKLIPEPSGQWGEDEGCLEGIVVDITDRVFLEKVLIQKEKLKTLGALSAEVAHEIRNPLVSIGGFARRLSELFPDSPECRIIVQESERMERILDRIRNYLKPVEFRRKQCSLNAILHSCVDLLSPEIARKQSSCRLDLDQNLPSIYADPEILRQVFINLIRNAVDAMDTGESVGIKTFTSDQGIHTVFENPVKDSRKPKDPELLFLPFDEGGQTTGLPLCYRLVKNMGGFLSFEQEEDHMVFSVSLPRSTSVGFHVGQLT